jgi:hypothetical protein
MILNIKPIPKEYFCQFFFGDNNWYEKDDPFCKLEKSGVALIMYLFSAILNHSDQNESIGRYEYGLFIANQYIRYEIFGFRI